MTRPGIVLPVAIRLALAGLLAAACTTAGGAATVPIAAPTPTPVPTPAAAPVSSPEDAAARVVATDKRFAGASQRQPDSIGLSKWWDWKPLDNGAYEISVTLGWGDCPAGCINRHTWVFDVAADGTVKPVGDTGDAVPDSLR
jgi:hypothetical protein